MILPDPLPDPDTVRGDPRRVGVEIELGALDETRIAQLLARDLGGAVQKADKGWTVTGSALGDLEIYLDSRYLDDPDSALGRALRDVARQVVPVEIVTEPITPGQIADLDRALSALRAAGATGTAAGLFLGFGVHFNPEVTGETLDDILPVLTAFALLEDLLRDRAAIDPARRALPFVDPFPRSLVDALTQDPPRDLPALIDLVLDHAPSRNHALDMTCLFAHLDEPRVAARMDMAAISARPTYHFRLPDCRIDEPDWTLAAEWNRWVLVERVAADPALLDRLRSAWRDHRSALTTLRTDWAVTCQGLLDSAQGAA